MLKRGVNNTHFQIVKLDSLSSLLFEIYTSLKHFFEKVPFLDPHPFRLTKTFLMIHILMGQTSHPSIHSYHVGKRLGDTFFGGIDKPS